MPYLETPDELAEFLANQLGIYGAHEDGEANECRCCFVAGVKERIRNAVKNEKLLDKET
jgi:hypothetical protein